MWDSGTLIIILPYRVILVLGKVVVPEDWIPIVPEGGYIDIAEWVDGFPLGPPRCVEGWWLQKRANAPGTVIISPRSTGC